ncbi:hypothetical protein [Paenibacillus eucommiae]|uniref:Holin n=1 Tax=Paenibacillus eucommiae TaxID=1355755 RepID=A0ABS4ISQ0_9BACL|nr:hypothetical protein [Paenibacillus eucommiae]MBP1990575.1 hypothetical protein [Paenibacillus eucommiae]
MKNLMKQTILRSIPSFVHVLLTVLYLDYLLASNLDFLESRIIPGFVVLIITNAITNSIFSKGQWRQIPFSAVSFIMLFILYFLILSVVGDPNREVDDNKAAGFALITIGMPASLLSLALGTIVGVTIAKLRNQIKQFNQHEQEKEF